MLMAFFGIVSSAKSDNPCCVSADEIKSGAKKAVVFYGAKFLLIQEDVVNKIKCACRNRLARAKS